MVRTFAIAVLPYIWKPDAITLEEELPLSVKPTPLVVFEM
jgi:hypothetical protein